MNDLMTRLTSILNMESRENFSNTPDFILAEYMMDCLKAFERANNRRDTWYGISPEPGWDRTKP